MPGTCVIGLQWGDEAKGKLVDLLTSQFDIVVRYQGGANAGHTVVLGEKVFKLHHIPSGILRPGVMNVVAPGVVINPPMILDEIDGLVARGIDVFRSMILSDRAHVVCPWHLAEDRILDQSDVGGGNIGTTLRGIGPCYRDKVGRTHALRLGDLLATDLESRIHRIVESKQPVLDLAGETVLDADQIFQEYSKYAERLRPMIQETTHYLLDAVESGKSLLFEGAQGSLLDIDHGTYPFVTSSNSSGVGVSPGSGVPGRWVDKTIGVLKAYTTRVGGGPFPTELEGEVGQHIRDMGNEYGTTTGRARRCGWFDAVAVRYTARLSGVSALAMTMLDVLSKLPEIKVCVAYELDGKKTNCFPSQVDKLNAVVPVYETLPGWQEEVSSVREWDKLPENARRYIHRIAELAGVPVEFISVGPDRDETILVDRPSETFAAAVGSA